MTVDEAIDGFKTRLQSSFSAVSGKGGQIPSQLSDMTTYTLSSAIESIPAGGGQAHATMERDVNFYDYDGTLLYSYTLDEVQALTALPEQPEHEGLVADGWSVLDLATLKANNCMQSIGAHYDTDDGSTRLKMVMEDDGYTTVNLCFRASSNISAIINWGDGTEVEIGLGETHNTDGTYLSHTYTPTSFPYNFTISIKPEYKRVYGQYGNYFELGYGSSAVNVFGKFNTSGGMQRRKHIDNMLREINFGHWMSCGQYAFRYCTSLEKFSCPRYSQINTQKDMTGKKTGTILNASGIFQNCYSLRFATLPASFSTVFPGNMFASCYSLKGFTIFPYKNSANDGTWVETGVTPLASTFLSKTTALKSFVIPPQMKINSTTTPSFNGFYCLNKIWYLPNAPVKTVANSSLYNCEATRGFPDQILSSVVSIGSSAFYNCYSLRGRVGPFSPELSSIGSSAFQYAMANVYDFSNLTSIPKMTSNTCLPKANFDSQCSVLVPQAMYDDFCSATNWSLLSAYIYGV